MWLLANPTAAGWPWVIAALVLSLFVKSRRLSRWLHPVNVGISIYCISRDFQLPMDTVMLACLPVAVTSWPQWQHSTTISVIVLIAAIINWCLASPVKVPEHDWLPAVCTFVFVNSANYKWVRMGLVLARFLVPRAAHVVYGLPLMFEGADFTQGVLEWFPFYNLDLAALLAYTLCSLLTTEEWYLLTVPWLGVAAYISSS